MQAYLVTYVVYHVVVASRSSHMIFMKLMDIGLDLRGMKNLKGT